MAVTIKGSRVPAPPAAFLNEGDAIEIGMSHELKIDGDATWLSYKVATKVGVGETSDDASARALQYLTNKMEHAVQVTVAHVQRMSS
jgi:hypothetical protein